MAASGMNEGHEAETDASSQEDMAADESSAEDPARTVVELGTSRDLN